MTSKNPWLTEALARNTKTYGGTDEHDEQAALIRGEYAHGYSDTPDCLCGGRMFWKASIGAYKCPRCVGLLTADGQRL